VVEALQRRVAAEFGLPEAVGLAALRGAEVLCAHSPEDAAEVHEISLYRKFNRCRDGGLREGDPPPDAPLTRCRDGAATSLHALLHGAGGSGGGRAPLPPLVVFAGSYT
jgi:hypothetical protein